MQRELYFFDVTMFDRVLYFQLRTQSHDGSAGYSIHISLVAPQIIDIRYFLICKNEKVLDIFFPGRFYRRI